MTATDIVLVLFIIALLAYAIYDEFIMPRRHSETLLSLPLLPRGRVDAIIFVGLIAILIYNNVTSHGALLTTWLLCALALMAILYIQLSPKYNRVAGAPAQAAGNNDLDNELD